MMTMIRTSIRLVPNPKRTPGKLLTFLNRGVIGEVGTEQFATVSMLTYDENSRTVTYANAAHPPLLLYRSETQSLLDIDAPGLPIGVEQREMYREKSFRVTAGDVLILFTDGIPETRALDGGEYTNEGLRNRIQQCAQKSAKEIVKSIQGDLDSFAAGVEQYDDQTMIVLKVKE